MKPCFQQSARLIKRTGLPIVRQHFTGEQMSLAKKVVLITGAGSGIGADAARAFREAGSFVVLNGRREDALRRVADSIDPTGKFVAIVPGDIGDARTSRRMVETAVERFDGVDVLFNN